MSKRVCPWIDGTPQRKTCVREGAVGGEAEKKAVYGNSLFPVVQNTPELYSSLALVRRHSLQAPLLPHLSGVQRRGADANRTQGELLRSPHKSGNTPSSVCPMCECPLLSGAPCGRCEKAVCVQCQRQCSLCLRTHCFACCLPNYDERFERMVCIDCQAL